MDDNIKIIRLVTGEDIVAYCNENDGNIQLKNPVRIIYRYVPSGKGVMMLLPWLPVELIENDSVMIYADDIITIMTPNESFLTYYKNLSNSKENDVTDFDSDVDEGKDEASVMMEEEYNVWDLEKSNTKITMH